MICGKGGISELLIGGITFGGLGLQGEPDGFSVRNILEGLFTEEVTVAGNNIFELGFKFAASDHRW